MRYLLFIFCLFYSAYSFSQSTGLQPPAATGEDFTEWTNPANAYASDDSRATVLYDIYPADQDYYNFSFSIPTGSTIDGIVVSAEIYQNDANPYYAHLDLELSWNGGTTYTTSGNNIVTTTSYTDQELTAGGSTDDWGHTWSEAELGNANFRLKATFTADEGGGPWYSECDQIRVSVYYTSPSGGGDTLYVDPISGNDANDGTTKALAIKTLSHLNTVYGGFDVVALADTAHYGALSFDNWNGSVGTYKEIISWNKYGKKTNIKGTTQLTSWTSAGVNLWEKTSVLLPSTETFYIVQPGTYSRNVHFMGPLMIDNVPYGVGTYPNGSTYNDMDAVGDATNAWFSEVDQNFTVNEFQNAWVYYGQRDWIPDKAKVSSNTANVVTLRAADLGNYAFTAWSSSSHLKYKFMNSVACLDQNGEWAYNYVTKKLTLYHTTNPSSLSIWASTEDSVLTVSNSSYVKVNGVNVYNGHMYSININTCDNVYVDSCNVYNSAIAGIIFRGCTDSYARWDTIKNFFDNGVITFAGVAGGSSNIQYCVLDGNVTYNYIGDQTGVHGNGIMDRYTEGTFNAEYNQINNTQYNGFEIDADNNHTINIYRNYVTNFCMHLADGGGLHTGFGSLSATRTIRGNYFGNAGTNYNFIGDGKPFSIGIYLDQYSSYFTVDSNTTYNVQSGFYQQWETAHNNVRNNTFVKFDVPGMLSVYGAAFTTQAYWDYHTADFDWKKNTIVMTNGTNSMGFALPSDGVPEFSNFLADSNNYHNPFRTDNLCINSIVSGYSNYYTLAQWFAISGFEEHSTFNSTGWDYANVSGITQSQFVWVFYNYSSTNHDFNLEAATFKDLTGATIDTTLTLEPFRSKVLFYASGSLVNVDNPIYVGTTTAYLSEYLIYKDGIQKLMYLNGVQKKIYK